MGFGDDDGRGFYDFEIVFFVPYARGEKCFRLCFVIS